MAFLTYMCFFVVFLVLLICYISVRRTSNVPHVHAWPFFGQFFHFMKINPYDYLINIGKIHGPIFQIKLGSQWVVVLNRADLIKEAFGSPKFSNRPNWLSMKLQSESPYHFAFRASGPEWKFLRKTSVKALSMLKFSSSSRVELRCQQAVEKLCSYLQEKGNHPLNPSWAIFHCVCTIMGTISFGSEFSSDDQKLSDILGSAQDTSRLTRIGSFVDCFPWLSVFFRRSIKTLRIQNEIFDDYVIGTLKLHKRNEKLIDLADALGRISEHYPNGSFDQLRSRFVAIDLFGAGMFTTITTLEWAFLILSKLDHIRIEMRNEINHYVDIDAPVTLADKRQLPYCESVVNEVLRFCTVLPFGVPRGTSENADLNGYFIPANVAVLPNLWAVNHDPSVFQHPYEFDPRRFLNSNNTLNTSMISKVMSFSTGVRQCPGQHLARQNLFIILTNVVKRFEMTLISRYDDLNKCELNFSRKPLPYELTFKYLYKNH